MHNETGLLVAPENTDETRKAIAMRMDDATMRERMASLAANGCKKSFSIATMAEKHITLYESVRPTTEFPKNAEALVGDIRQAVATAASCTGGAGKSYMHTSGSSVVFGYGIASYANGAKKAIHHRCKEQTREMCGQRQVVEEAEGTLGLAARISPSRSVELPGRGGERPTGRHVVRLGSCNGNKAVRSSNCEQLDLIRERPWLMRCKAYVNALQKRLFSAVAGQPARTSFVTSSISSSCWKTVEGKSVDRRLWHMAYVGEFQRNRRIPAIAAAAAQIQVEPLPPRISAPSRSIGGASQAAEPLYPWSWSDWSPR